MLAQTLAKALIEKKLKLATAESCTGGGLSATLTEVSGSSAWFERGFITYSNQAKHEMLKVPEAILHKQGAVSEAVVQKMAEGAVLHSNADLSVAISGIAGPSGGTKDKPVGTVWIGFAGARQPTVAKCYHFKGSRDAVRKQAIAEALNGLIERVYQFTHPTPSPRYFLALWPDEKTQNRLFETASEFTKTTPCTPSLAQNLHVTLAFLGGVNPEQINHILPHHCTIPAFTLETHQIKHWDKQAIAYFSVADSKPLTQLHADITQHLLAQGFKPERREFVPHITLARNYRAHVHHAKFEPITWHHHELCLVKSVPAAHQSQYEIIKRIPLL